MEGKRARLKIADLKRRPMRQQSGTEEELKALAQSWLERPVHDIIVCPSRKVVDGHRRLDGAGAARRDRGGRSHHGSGTGRQGRP